MDKAPNVGVQLNGTGLLRVVFESGFSQSGESLRNDMLDWLLGGRVLSRLSFLQSNPILTFATWNCGLTRCGVRPTT
ncbi:hypothetical protein BDV39DRAFT_166858 [Aspergillus sergii]|uniref:Uncharacterized protein n=1 Tax=Aspergillus sergii TaxID=1034303 RepID=A0A5N6XI37_9EURO|nr:hypothetical protein BDV39DRAFT_166858 [Aspergillus sergii]